MKKKTNQKLSSGEMELMSMLWEHGSLALSEAHGKLGRPIGYTTMQTRLNRLVDKGLAKRSKDRPARYEAVLSPDHVSFNHLDDLINRVTGGSVVPLVAHLVDDRSISRDDLNELKKIIQDAERRFGKGEGES